MTRASIASVLANWPSASANLRTFEFVTKPIDFTHLKAAAAIAGRSQLSKPLPIE